MEHAKPKKDPLGDLLVRTAMINAESSNQHLEVVHTLMVEVRRLHAFETFVREQVKRCPQHGLEKAKYRCPEECPWPVRK